MGVESYPKTPHLPFSPEVSEDDITLFCEEEVVITEKLDGANCLLFKGKVFGRTHQHEANHSSFAQVKQLYSCFSFLVPEDLQLFGECMTGIHSIEYAALKSHFYLFAIYRLKSRSNESVSNDNQGIPHFARFPCFASSNYNRPQIQERENLSSSNHNNRLVIAILLPVKC